MNELGRGLGTGDEKPRVDVETAWLMHYLSQPLFGAAFQVVEIHWLSFGDNRDVTFGSSKGIV